MKKEKILERIKALENNPRISNLAYSKELLYDDREESLWYGGPLLQYVIDNRYNVSFSANGDNIGCVLFRNCEVKYYKDKCNRGYLGHLLETNGLTKDSDFILKCQYYDDEDGPDMTPFEENENLKAVIYLDYSNWFEIFIDDSVTGKDICVDDIVDFEEMFETDMDDFFDMYFDDFEG